MRMCAPTPRAGDQQRMANIVAVADVGELHAARGAEFLFEREKIGTASGRDDKRPRAR